MIQTIRKLQIVACLAGFILAGCGLLPRTPEKPKQERNPVLVERVALYKSLQKDRLDILGWVQPKCDSLLFTSLCKVAGGCSKANILMARDEAGAWHRDWHRDCWQTGGSASTISKDMLMGLAYYAAFSAGKQEGCQIAQGVLDYAISHNLVMGQPASEVGRVIITPSLIGVFSDIEELQCPTSLKRLAAPQTDVEDILDALLVRQGFAAHLQVLRITLTAKLKGGVSALDLEVLRRLAQRESENALFQAAYHKFHDGIQYTAEQLLLNERRFPQFHLPDLSNYCTHYLWQRDMASNSGVNPDWLPCSDGKWDGVDFLFAAWMAGY